MRRSHRRLREAIPAIVRASDASSRAHVVDDLHGRRRIGERPAQPEMRERLEREGVELIPGTPERPGALIEADLVKWKKLIAEARVELE